MFSGVSGGHGFHGGTRFIGKPRDQGSQIFQESNGFGAQTAKQKSLFFPVTIFGTEGNSLFVHDEVDNGIDDGM